MSPLCIFPYQATHLVMKISYYHVLPLYCTIQGVGHDSRKFLVSCPPPVLSNTGGGNDSKNIFSIMSPPCIGQYRGWT